MGSRQRAVGSRQRGEGRGYCSARFTTEARRAQRRKRKGVNDLRLSCCNRAWFVGTPVGGCPRQENLGVVSEPNLFRFSVTFVPPWCLVLDPLLSAMASTALCLLPHVFCLLPTAYRLLVSVYCYLHAVLPLLAPGGLRSIEERGVARPDWGENQPSFVQTGGNVWRRVYPTIWRQHGPSRWTNGPHGTRTWRRRTPG